MVRGLCTWLSPCISRQASVRHSPKPKSHPMVSISSMYIENIKQVIFTNMKCSTTLLNAHIVTSTKNLTVCRDQSCANGHTTFRSAFPSFFERNLKANVTLHLFSNV